MSQVGTTRSFSYLFGRQLLVVTSEGVFNFGYDGIYYLASEMDGRTNEGQAFGVLLLGFHLSDQVTLGAERHRRVRVVRVGFYGHQSLQLSRGH